MRDHASLIALLEGRAAVPFAWGRQDCVLFAADAAQAQTGRDFRAEIRALAGTWRSGAGAARALQPFGGLKGAADRVLRRVSRAKAMRGDIGLAEVEGRESLVVIEGDTVVGPGLTGLVRLQRGSLTAAWSLEGTPLAWWRA